MTKQEKVSAWLLSIGFKKINAGKGWFKDDGPGEKLLYVSIDEATFFYDVTEKAKSDVVSTIYGIANDLAHKDPKAIGSVSLAPYFANALAIYQEYLKGGNYERIDWKSLDLPTLRHLKQEGKTNE